MKKVVFLLLAVVASLQVFAYSFEEGGIYYNITSSSDLTAEVTSGKNYGEYFGYVMIPRTVTSNGKTYTVKGIGSRAFSGCSGLSGVSFADKSVATYIGERAFSGCNAMTEVTIPATITSIGNYAFAGCISILYVTFEDSENTLSLGYGCNAGSNYGLFADSAIRTLYWGRPLSYNTSYGYSPFSNQVLLSKVTIGPKVKTLTAYMFYGNTAIHTLTLPATVTALGNHAFDGFSGLTTFTIPATVTSVGEYAFANCIGLTSFTIPTHLESLSTGLFSGCSGIKSLTVPKNITSIGNFAFNGCSALKELTFEDGDNVLNMGYCNYNGGGSTPGKGLFNDCPLNSVYVGRNLSYSTRIYEGYSPFYNNTTLKAVRFGNEVTSIPNYLCCNCSALTTLTYNQNCTPTIIGAYAFYGCKSLTEKDLKFPTSVTTLEASCFRNCTGLEGYTIPDHVKTVGESVFEGCLNLANVIVKPSVTSISNYAFNGCTALKELTFEDGDNTLSLGYNYYTNNGTGRGLFNDCPLNSVYIGRNLSYSTNKYYGYSPFYNHETLTSVRFGNEVTRIPNYVCYYCSALTAVQYNQECAPTEIGSYAFAGCKLLTEEGIGCPSSVTTICEGAFFNCTSLTSYTFSRAVASVDNYAFNGCTALKELTFEDGDNTLSLGYNYYTNNGTGRGLFNDCPLDSVYFGRNLSYSTNKYYGYSPFYNNTTLTSIRFGNEITRIPDYICCNCTAMAMVAFNQPCNPEAIGFYAFSGCKSLTDKGFEWPTSVKTFNDGAFNGCTQLTDFVLPDGLETVGANCFNGCAGLEKITIPASVTKVNNYAFSGCTSLKSVVLEDGKEDLSLGYGSSKGESYALFGDSPLNTLYLGRGVSVFYSGSPNLTGLGKCGYSPFANQKALYDITIGPDVEWIPTCGFYGDEMIQEITIPEGCQRINDFAFQGCVRLRTVNMPSTLKKIGESAFSGCTRFSEMTFPGNLESIGNYAFSGCTNLQYLYFNDGKEPLTLGYGASKGQQYGLFYDCPLQLIEFGRTFNYESGSKYGYSPFANQEQLRGMDISLNGTVKSLGPWMFHGCTTLYTVLIPPSVTEMSTTTFSECSNLSYILCFTPEPPTMNASGNVNFFSSTATDSRIFAMDMNKYKQASGWSACADKITRLCRFDTDFTYSGQPQTVEWWFAIPIEIDEIETEVDAGTYTKKINLHSEPWGYDGTYDLTYTIQKANLYVSTESAERLYGEDDPEFVLSYEGFVNGEDESVLEELPILTTSTDRTTSPGVYTVGISGGSAKNYNLIPNEGQLTINKRPLLVTADDAERYYGEDNPKFTFYYAGFADGEDESFLNIRPKVYCEATATSDAGEYPILVADGSSKNYEFEYHNGRLIINKAEQEIIWEDQADTLVVGSQIQLTARASSGLPIEYKISDESILELYEAGGKTYVDCLREGVVVVRAFQNGDQNHEAAARASKTFVVVSTGITTMDAENLRDEQVYDLQGRRVLYPTKGIYIVNGQKVLIK